MINSKENRFRIRIASSSCLLGQEVRYDGKHKLNEYMTKSLGEYFEFVPFCPEVAIGLGIPRQPICLVRREQGIRAVAVSDRDTDLTGQLTAYAEQVVTVLDGVSGYIFKQGSPSCGTEQVKIYTDSGDPVETAAGVYAATIMKLLPELPVEEEGRLMDPAVRENFIERLFVYRRWQQLQQAGLTAARLTDFHTRHKLSVMAHDEQANHGLDRLVAEAGTGGLQALGRQYIGALMKALKTVATFDVHANVLMHIISYLNKNLEHEEKEELLALVDSLRAGQVPLIVPLTVIKHYLRRFPEPYLEQQVYINPHPQEMMLRYHI